MFNILVKIRLNRCGRKAKPFYRVVVADSRSKRSGKFIEQIGYYDPIRKSYFLDTILAKKWLENGAQPTSTVCHIFLVLKK